MIGDEISTPPLPAPDPILKAIAYHDMQAMIASEAMWGERRRGLDGRGWQESYERHVLFSNAIRQAAARSACAKAEVARLRAENGMLREALRPFVQHYDRWMDDWPDDTESVVHSRHTHGQLRAARAALSSDPQTMTDGERR